MNIPAEYRRELTVVTSNTHPHSHSHSHPHKEESKSIDTIVSADNLERLRLFLQAHFGEVVKPSNVEGDDSDLLALDIKVDDVEARLDLLSMVRLTPTL